jgi:hypothetical protein
MKGRPAGEFKRELSVCASERAVVLLLLTYQPPGHPPAEQPYDSQQAPPDDGITPQDHPQLLFASLCFTLLDPSRVVIRDVFFLLDVWLFGESKVGIGREDVVSDIDPEEVDGDVAYRYGTLIQDQRGGENINQHYALPGRLTIPSLFRPINPVRSGPITQSCNPTQSPSRCAVPPPKLPDQLLISLIV